MKNRIILFVLVLVFSISLSLSLSACKNAKCKHEWENSTVLVEATCTTVGSQEQICSKCGSTQSIEISALGHDLKPVSGKDATCTESGFLEYEQCSRCDYNTKGDNLPKLDHSFGVEWEFDDNGHWHECVRDNCTVKSDEGSHADDNNDHKCDNCTYVMSNCKSNAVPIVKKDATCTEDGNIEHWTCTDCNKNFSDEECTTIISESVTISALGHNMVLDTTKGVDGYTWADDYSSCTAHGKCDRQGCTYTEDANATLAPNIIQNATCTLPERCDIDYSFSVSWAKGSRLDLVQTKPALGHTYGKISYAFNDEYTAFTATRLCSECVESVDGHTQTATSTSHFSYAITKQPTCTETGEADYLVYFGVDWISDPQIVSVRLQPNGHKIKSAPAKDATCTEDGNIEHWTCTDCNKNFSDEECTTIISESVTISALGHNMVLDTTKGVDGYTWADDYSSCTAHGKCDRQGCTHTEDANATITPSLKQVQSCINDEIYDYTATFTVDWAETKTLSNIVTNSALGHTYGKISYAFNDEHTAFTATRSCSECVESVEGHAQTATSNDFFMYVQYIYCTKEGSDQYKVYFNEDWLPHSQLVIVPTSPAGHNFTAETVHADYLKSEANCQSAAIYYKSCANCGLSSVGVEDKEATFTNGEKDSSNHASEEKEWVSIDGSKHKQVWKCCGTTIIEEAHEIGVDGICTKCKEACAHSLIIHYEEKEATCTEDGNVEYWSCTDCKKNFSDEECTTIIGGSVTISALGHNMVLDTTKGVNGYTWADDYSSCTSHGKCDRQGCTHTEDANATVSSSVTTEKDCINDEMTTYKATFDASITWATTQTNEVKTADKLGHNIVLDTTKGVDGYTWADDYSSCTAHGKCDRQGCTYTEDANATVSSSVTTEKNCINDEMTTYKATFDASITWATTQTNEVKTADKLGHNIVLDTTKGVDGYTWADDYSSCTAHGKCNRTGCTHTEDADATIRMFPVEDATCTTPERTDIAYTFSVSWVKGSRLSLVKTKPALGHDFDTDNWSIDDANGHYHACKRDNCNEKDSLTAHTFENGICSECGDYDIYGTEGLVYSFNSSKNTYSVTGYNGTETEVRIPSYYNNETNGVFTVTSVSGFFQKDITAISLPDTITTIVGGAFGGSKLTSISIPDSVTSIGSCAFESCTDLSTIAYPDNLYNISDRIFHNTAWYNKQPNGIIYLNDTLVYGYKGVNGSLEIKDGATVILPYAFSSNTDITEVIIPDSVKIIGKWAFNNARNLKSIVIGTTNSALERFERQAAAGADSLGTVTFKGSYEAFKTATENGSALELYNSSYWFTNIGANTKLICNDEIVVISATAKDATCTERGNISYYYNILNGKYYTSKDFITEITENVFINIIEHTFGDWSNEVPATCTSTGTKGHKDCLVCGKHFDTDGNEIENITISIISTAHNYGEWSSNNDGTHSRTCSYNSEHIETVNCSGGSATCTEKAICSVCSEPYGDLVNHTFDQQKTESTYLASEATCIAKAKYYYSCTCGEKGTKTYEYGEIDIHFLDNDGVCTVCDRVIENPKGITYTLSSDKTYYSVSGYTGTAKSVRIAENYNGLPVKEIASNAFLCQFEITEVIIPSSVTKIKESAFENCISLISVNILGKETSIGDYAFYMCYSLTSITIPDSVTSIGKDAFRYCYKLVEVINKSQLNITKGSSSNGYVAYYALNVKTEGTSDIVNADDYLFYTQDSTNYLLGYIGNQTDLILPAQYNGQNYEIYRYAFCHSIHIDGVFYNLAELTSVRIPDSVTSIGDSAFDNCWSLTSVTIGSGVSSIGNDAFSCCFKLVEVINKSELTITKGDYENGQVANYALNIKTEGESDIVNVDDYLFYTHDGTNYLLGYTGSQTDLILPAQYNGQNYEIYKYAFAYCSSLTSVTIGSDVTLIAEYAFYNCSSLTSVTIGSGVTSIGNNAFNNCSSLTSITIPDIMTSIGEYAFNNCSSLTSVTIGNGMTSIGYGAFDGCNKLAEVINKSSLNIIKGSSDYGYVAYYALNVKTEGVSDIVNVDDYLFYTTTEGTSYLFAYIGNETDLVLPDTYNGQNYEIYKRAFFECSSLTSVTIGNGVTSIGENAFANCSSLKSVIIGSGVTSIGSIAFANCSSLKSVTIPDSVTSIGEYTFHSCSSLTSVTIGSGVTSIGKYVFYNCYSLTSVTIGNGVTSIGELAFYNCSSLKNVIIGNGVTSIYENAFEGCNEAIVDDNGVYYVGNWVIGADKKITSAIIKDGTRGIADCAFYNCYSLTSVTIPDSVTSIGELAFYNCSSLTSVTIGNGVTSIGYRAFYNCSSLTNVYYKGNTRMWNDIYMNGGNSIITSEKLYYYSESNPFDGEGTAEGNYWHYDTDGKTPAVWTK